MEDRYRLTDCDHPVDHDHSSEDAREIGPDHPRRRVLELAGGAVLVSIAGCLSSGGGDGGAATDVPVEPSEDDSCGVCNMTPADYPDWNAQLVFGDGTRVHFCSPGCFVAFYADPGHFMEGRSQEVIANSWVNDYRSKELTAAAAASYVLEMNADRIDAPMMMNPVPFADEADAQTYVDQYDDLGADDVVGIEAFDLELAKQYRGRFFE